eukprot:TRINITY_DN65592_c7_g1_i1.p1 TRINITY_DN65592_c7_g1~~TRINITY_DN65592_c7_g1_i1.p1  ORF type:complete len:655 (-),score=322.37 TRINITY_DN65592_c7_g1_i1:80-1876(-)
MGVPLWLVGATLSIVGSTFSNLGVNLQKYALNIEVAKPENEQRPYVKIPLWVAGFGMVTFGSLFDLSALAFAAQSIVATVGSSTLVANLFFAHFWLGEELRRMDIFGTAMIIAGASLAIAFGDKEEVKYSIDDLIDNYQRVEFLFYCFIVGGICVLLYLAVRIATPLRDAIIDTKKSHNIAVHDRDLNKALKYERSTNQLLKSYAKWEKLHPVAFCALAGTFGGFVLIFAKSTAEMVRSTASGSNQFTNPLTYLFIVCMLAAIVIETHFLAQGLKYFDALYIVPVFQCFFVMMGALSGGLYFGEFSRFSKLQAIFFPIGVFITICGVWLLSSREMGGDDSSKAVGRGYIGARRSITNMSQHNNEFIEHDLRGSGTDSEVEVDENGHVVHHSDHENIDDDFDGGAVELQETGRGGGRGGKDDSGAETDSNAPLANQNSSSSVDAIKVTVQIANGDNDSKDDDDDLMRQEASEAGDDVADLPPTQRMEVSQHQARVRRVTQARIRGATTRMFGSTLFFATQLFDHIVNVEDIVEQEQTEVRFRRASSLRRMSSHNLSRSPSAGARSYNQKPSGRKTTNTPAAPANRRVRSPSANKNNLTL